MRILVVHDSPDPRLLLKRELEALGHECIVAEDGTRGWHLIQGGGLEVVMCGWRLPGAGGAELSRRISSIAAATRPYLILLIAADDRGHVVRGLGAGADDYLTMPFDGDELFARLMVAEHVTDLRRTLAEQELELRRLNASLLDGSLSDSLTGLGNRRRQAEDLAKLASQGERYGDSFAVALIDLDEFRSYNERAGFAAGDDVLRRVAAALMRQCRSGDLIYRYGGEELLAVFPNQSLETGAIAADRMREAIEALAIPHQGLEAGAVVTASAGIACFEPGRGDEVDQLLQRAESALSAAKEAGRNRVVSRERAPDRAV